MATTNPSSLRVASTPREPRMLLSAVTRGKRVASDRILLVGVEGVGKSTFGSEAPNPIFVAAEDGIRHLDVAAFPEPQTLDDVYEAIEQLRETEHDFKTLVLDTIDWVEPLIFRQVCRRNGWDNIESPGYGKGYPVAVDETRLLLSRLDQLRLSRSMEIILLGHALITTFQNPAGPDFSRYEISLHKKIAPIVKQWADVNLFATFEEFTSDPKKGKVKGVSTGNRVIHTERCAAWDAKNRCDLPPTIPLSYADYAAARGTGLQVEASDALAACRALLDQLAVSADAPARQFVEANRDNPAELVRALNRLRVMSDEAKPQTERTA